MTKSEREIFSHKLYNNPPLSSIDMINDTSTAVSDLSNVSKKFFNTQQSQKVTALNYTSGNSAIVLDTIVAEKDLMEARERNRLKKMEGNDIKNKLAAVKTVTAMFHFNNLGCVIGKDALQKKQHIVAIQQSKILQARKKEESVFQEKKLKYEEIVALNLSDDKLKNDQLKTLLAYKKRKLDKPFSGLNKKNLLQLWKEWKNRIEEPPTFENSIVQSVALATVDETITETNDDSEQDTISISQM